MTLFIYFLIFKDALHHTQIPHSHVILNECFVNYHVGSYGKVYMGTNQACTIDVTTIVPLALSLMVKHL